MDEHAANNTGNYPADNATVQSVVQSDASAHTGTTVVYKASFSSSDLPAANIMFYYKGFTCDGKNPVA